MVAGGGRRRDGVKESGGEGKKWGLNLPFSLSLLLSVLRFRRHHGWTLQLGDPLQRRLLNLPSIPRRGPLVIQLGETYLAGGAVLFRLGEVGQRLFPLGRVLLLVLAADVGEREERRFAAGIPSRRLFQT